MPPGVLASAIDQLVVWSPPVKIETRGLMQQSVAQVEGDKVEGDFDAWLQLPFSGPRQVILPQLSSAAASGAKGSADGSGLFLTACNLIAMGSQTGLLSRWYTGLVPSCQASTTFAKNVQNESAIDAWIATQEQIRQAPLDYSEGSRIRKPKEAPMDAKSDHPYFWAGYLLIDTGWAPPSEPTDGN